MVINFVIIVSNNLLYSSPAQGTIRRWFSVYATAGGLIPHCATLQRGGQITEYLTAPVTVNVNSGTEVINTMTIMSSAPSMSMWVHIPWAGPSGTLQKVRYEILTAKTIDGTYTSMGVYEKNYRGPSLAISDPYQTFFINTLNIGSKYIKLKYHYCPTKI